MNTIYIVDGQKVVCQMLSECLATRGFEVIGFAELASDAVEEILEIKPSLVLTEMNFPDSPGACLISEIKASLPETRFLVFSDDKTSECIKACLQAGAHGFVEKSVDLKVLVSTVNIINQGGSYFGFNVTEVLRSVVRDTNPVKKSRDNLTDRERQVLELIANGNSNKDIAAKLELSVKTVDNHRCSMMRKLDLHNIAGITRYAIEHRFVPVDFVAS